MPLKLVFVLTLFNMAAFTAGRLVLALFALKLGAQQLAVGFLAATPAAITMLFSWPAGRFADRLGSRLPLLCSSIGMVVGMIPPYFFPGLIAIYFAAAMIGLSQAFSSVTLQNLVGLLSSPQDRAKNFSNFSLALSIAAVAGPLPMGFVIDHAGYSNACLYLGLFSVASIAAIVFYGYVLPGSTHDKAASKGSILSALGDRGVLRVLAISGLGVAAIELFQFYMPVYGHEIGLSASVTGLVVSMFGVAAFVVRLIIPKLLTRITPQELLAYAFFICAVSLAMVPFSKSAAVLVPIAFLFGLGAGCGPPVTMMIIFSSSVQGRSGESLGVRLTVNQLTRSVTPVLFGAIGSAFGVFPVFWVSALMLAAGGVLCRPPAGSAARE